MSGSPGVLAPTAPRGYVVGLARGVAALAVVERPGPKMLDGAAANRARGHAAED